MLVRRVRQESANPKLTVLVVQLGEFTREGRDFMGMREVQRKFIIEDGNALLVPTLGRPLKDTVHLNNKGYQELGCEIGRALLRTKYRKHDVNWPGPVLDAVVLNADGNSVVAHFSEVKRLHGCIPQDFAVLDSKGAEVCVSVKPGETIVELKFARSIQILAKLVYGFGENPKAVLEDEAGNRAPAVQITMATGAPSKDIPTNATNGAGTKASKAGL